MNNQTLTAEDWINAELNHFVDITHDEKDGSFTWTEKNNCPDEPFLVAVETNKGWDIARVILTESGLEEWANGDGHYFGYGLDDVNYWKKIILPKNDRLKDEPNIEELNPTNQAVKKATRIAAKTLRQPKIVRDGIVKLTQQENLLEKKFDDGYNEGLQDGQLKASLNQENQQGQREEKETITSDVEIKKYIDGQPYYGTCTTEYKEGIEQGAKWMREQKPKEQGQKEWDSGNPKVEGDYICRMLNAYIKMCHWTGLEWLDMWERDLKGVVVEWIDIPYNKEINTPNKPEEERPNQGKPCNCERCTGLKSADDYYLDKPEEKKEPNTNKKERI